MLALFLFTLKAALFVVSAGVVFAKWGRKHTVLGVGAGIIALLSGGIVLHDALAFVVSRTRSEPVIAQVKAPLPQSSPTQINTREFQKNTDILKPPLVPKDDITPATDTEHVVVAQNCSPNITVGGNTRDVTINCPNNSTRTNAPAQGGPAPAGGRMRNGVFIPNCPAGQGYSLDEQRCMSRQYIGGVIPCSQDDTVVCR